MVTLLRLLIAVGLVWVLARMLFKAPRSGSRRGKVGSRFGAKGKESEYGHLTDQRIEDADFEEIPPEDGR